MTQFFQTRSWSSQAAMPDPIALFLPSLKTGGAERVMVELANHFSSLGYPVDLVLVEKKGDFLRDVSPAVHIVDLKSRRTLNALIPLISYLRRRRPAGLISSMVHCNIVALLARSLARVQTRILIRQENTMSRAARNAPTKRGRRIPWVARRIYPKADAIIAVSNGVAHDLSESLNIPRRRIRTVYNPCAIEKVVLSRKQPVDHRWFVPGAPPVIVSMGRLHPQKDYGTLLKAFRIVSADREARLLIMGEGNERDRLTALAREVGISDSVSFPGSFTNPFPYLARAQVFVLSSRWEGHPLVLAEALACGITIVSTDCPSGPQEVLEGGRYGILVPMGDPEAIAQGIMKALDSPFPPELLMKRAEEFSVDIIAREYLNLLFG
ncbi:MAG: glycosyltransferase [Desulfomonilaceae bacterium]|nr:glycosyltransferase [Desulfomonilaceae bacterium]